MGVTDPRRIALAALLLASLAAPALADDRVDFTTTWFQERRDAPRGLTILHPQVDLGIDLGDHVTLGAGYAADVVTGATAAVYSVDAVSSATEFSDTRHSGTLSLGFAGRRSSLSIGGGVGVERDYTSISVTVGSTVDLPGKNTMLSLSYTHNFDAVCDKENAMVASSLEKRPLTVETCAKELGLFGVDHPEENGVVVDTVWRDVSIDTTQAALTQNLSPTAVAQVGVYGSVVRGFQSNPYRRVRVAGVEAQETVPDVRGRLAVTGRLKKFFPGPRGAVGFFARGYFDTWGIESATLEMDYHQYLGDALLVRLRGRAYQQTAAVFFKDAFFYETEGTAGEYFTGDRELAPLRNYLVGAKLSYIVADDEGRPVWGVFDEIELNLKGDVLWYQELEADGGNPMGIDDQYLTAGAPFDALILQLGLRMAY